MTRIPLWIDLRHVPVNKRLPYFHSVEETAVEHVLLAKDDPHLDRAGIQAVSVDSKGTIKQGKKALGKLLKVGDAKGQEKAAKQEGLVVVDATDWRVIPFENLIAARVDRPGTLYALAKTPEQAALFAETLEVGVHGVVLAPQSTQAIFDTDRALRERYRPPVPRRTPTVAEAAGGSDISDIVDLLPPSVRVAHEKSGHVLPTPASKHGGPVQPRGKAAPPLETTRPATGRDRQDSRQETKPAKGDARPEPRPEARGDGRKARADAPAAAAPQTSGGAFLVPATITSVADGGLGDRVCIDTTSIFRDGEGLLVGSTSRSFALVHAETISTEFVAKRPFRVNAGAVHMYLYAPDGKTRYLAELQSGTPVLAIHPDGVHRVILVGRCKIERRPHLLVRWQGPHGEGSAVLQNAETIRLVRPDGRAVAVTALKPGDKVLVHEESAARHVGMAVDEHLEER